MGDVINVVKLIVSLAAAALAEIAWSLWTINSFSYDAPLSNRALKQASKPKRSLSLFAGPTHQSAW